MRLVISSLSSKGLFNGRNERTATPPVTRETVTTPQDLFTQLHQMVQLFHLVSAREKETRKGHRLPVKRFHPTTKGLVICKGKGNGPAKTRKQVHRSICHLVVRKGIVVQSVIVQKGIVREKRIYIKRVSVGHSVILVQKGHGPLFNSGLFFHRGAKANSRTKDRGYLVQRV